MSILQCCVLGYCLRCKKLGNEITVLSPVNVSTNYRYLSINVGVYNFLVTEHCSVHMCLICCCTTF